jgi:hypothetical protein
LPHVFCGLCFIVMTRKEVDGILLTDQPGRQSRVPSEAVASNHGAAAHHQRFQLVVATPIGKEADLGFTGWPSGGFVGVSRVCGTPRMLSDRSRPGQDWPSAGCYRTARVGEQANSQLGRFGAGLAGGRRVGGTLTQADASWLECSWPDGVDGRCVEFGI